MSSLNRAGPPAAIQAIGRCDATYLISTERRGRPAYAASFVWQFQAGMPFERASIFAASSCADGSDPSHPASPVHRPHESEAHSATEPQPRDRKLASVAH
jgi:hypothetical protein